MAEHVLVSWARDITQENLPRSSAMVADTRRLQVAPLSPMLSRKRGSPSDRGSPFLSLVVGGLVGVSRMLVGVSRILVGVLRRLV